MEPNTQIVERNQFALNQDDNNDEIDLLKLWNTVWQRKWSIITLVVVVGMLASLYANSLTPIYQAEATLLIQRDTPKAVSFDQGYGYGYSDYDRREDYAYDRGGYYNDRPVGNYQNTDECRLAESRIRLPDGRTDTRYVRTCPDQYGRYRVVD